MILHADLDAFYAAVEQRDDPSLSGRSVVVGGSRRRGVVLTCSYEARRFGVRSGMAGGQARRLCPEAVFITPRMRRYTDISHVVQGVFRRYTPVMETIALDEAFLDVAGSLRLFGGAEAIGRRIRAEVLEETGLAISVGIASSKFVAKLASVESKPDGMIYVPPNMDMSFLDPLPVDRIWGAGQVAQRRLLRLGFQTIGDLRRSSLERLQCLFGRAAGLRYHQLSRGRDQRRVGTRSKSSLSHEETFAHDVCDVASAHSILLHLCESVARRLRKRAKRTGRVHLKMRYSDFKTVTRQRSVVDTVDERVIGQAARRLFDEHWNGDPVRLLGVAIDVADASQADLFVPEPSRLLIALDQIKDRHGDDAIGYAGGCSAYR